MQRSIDEQLALTRRSPMPAKTTRSLKTEQVSNGETNGHTNGHANGAAKKPAQLKTEKKKTESLKTESSKTEQTKPVEKPEPTKTVETVEIDVPETVETPKDEKPKRRARSATKTETKTETTETEAKSDGEKKKRKASKPKVDTKAAGKGARAKTKPNKNKPRTVDAPVRVKRNQKTKPLAIETIGIETGTARVRNVLRYVALNQREFSVRDALHTAENKPVMPRPTDETPNPTMPNQGVQVPITQMSQEHQDVINDAEAAYKQSLMFEYENQYLKTLEESNPQEFKRYNEAYKSAKSSFDEKTKISEETKLLNALVPSQQVSVEFNNIEFNKQFNSNFYNDFAAFQEANDMYQIGKVYQRKSGNKSNNGTHTYNQWSRAAALVNKLAIRLSSHTHYIIAAFLDRIVEQYAENGIRNCLRDGHRTVSLKHAITENDQFAQTCYLRSFVESCEHYTEAVNWLDSCADMKESHRQARQEKKTEDAKPQLPAYPYKYEDKYSFAGYVSDLCKYVRKQMAEKESDADRKQLLLTTNISNDFKQFFSHILYEVILRIGKNLKILVDSSGVKTVSDSMVYQSIKQIHATCGLDYTRTEVTMSKYLTKFAEVYYRLKKERSNNRK